MKFLNLFLWPNLDFVSFDQQFPKCIHPLCSSACSFSPASVRPQNICSSVYGLLTAFNISQVDLCFSNGRFPFVEVERSPSCLQIHYISTHSSDDETQETDSVFLPLRINNGTMRGDERRATISQQCDFISLSMMILGSFMCAS